MEKLGKKLKHDHTLTSILKFAIFSVIMLAPIFSVASRCLYVICNKNAKDSYSTNVVKETIQINNFSDIQQGKMYEYVPVDKGLNNTSPRFTFTSLSFDFYEKYPTAPVHEYDSFLVIGANRVVYWYYGEDRWTGAGNLNFEFGFVAGIQATSGNTFGNFNIYTTNYVELKLDNAFEYSLSQLEESNYYNWATNLGIYTPIYNMVHGLGGHDIIALLLAYWSIYTAIYIVFDIVIACFVKITHLLQSE